MRLTFPILAVLLVVPVAAQWNRYAQAGRGEQIVVAEPHPLAYFTHDAVVRGDEREVGCISCSAAQKAEMLAEGRAEVSRVGKVGDYTIFDVFYFYTEPKWGKGRSILVQTGEDQYREILYVGNGDRYDMTHIVGDTPPNQMLWTTTGYGAMGMTVDDQFWVGDGMSVRLDLKAVVAAKEATMKSAGIVQEKPWNRQMPLPTFNSKSYELVSHDFAGDGSVDVSFKIDHGRAIVTGTRYTPSRRP